MVNFDYYITVSKKCNGLRQLAFSVKLCYIVCGDDMKKQIQGTLALLLATVIWGSAFVAQSVGMDHIGPFTFQVIRCILAAAVLLPAAAIRNPKAFANKKLWISGFLCGSALFAASSLQQIGLVYTDAGKAGFLTAMYIVLVPIIGAFLGTKPGKNIIFSVTLAVVGLYLLSCTGVSSINPGDILLIGCAFAFAVQITLIDRLAPDMDGMALNAIQCLVCGAWSVPFMLLTETPEMSAIFDCTVPLLYAGVLSLGIAYTLQIYGQQRLEPAKASLLMSLESVFAVLTGWLILNETMTVEECIGCVLIFSAVVISQLPGKE